jgi:peptide/nickel transport system substrate-binding protein
MKRRDLLTLGAAAATLHLPRLARAQDQTVLRFVPQADLAVLDPVFATAYVTRNHAFLVFDTLYGIDDAFNPQPQMLAGHTVENDGRLWTLTLRDGLSFHDGTPVLGRDALASIQRWAQRDAFGASLLAATEEMSAPSDRTVRIRLRKPFPMLPLAMGHGSNTMLPVMPERLARTPPNQAVTEMVGSGPYRFLADERVAGSRAVYQRFAGYQPRSDGRTSFTAGPKVAYVERIEWQTIPDAATAAGALQAGEIDWWENPLPDLVPLLKRNRNLNVDIADPLGNIGSFRMNHLHPPFNDVRARRAVLMALSQEDYMRALVGEDETLWKPLPSFFTPGTATYSEAGGEILKGPRRYDEAKRLLAEAGYKGEKVVLCVATDIQITKAQGDVTADLLQKIGMDVDYQALDWGTVGARRAKKDPPSQGGWNIFHTWHAGSDCANPAPYTAFDAGGDKAWFGWPNSPKIQEGIAAWYDAPDLEAEKKAIADLNREAMEFVTYAPTGFFLQYQSWRKNVSGVVKAPFPVFWGVQKS